MSKPLAPLSLLLFLLASVSGVEAEYPICGQEAGLPCVMQPGGSVFTNMTINVPRGTHDSGVLGRFAVYGGSSTTAECGKSLNNTEIRGPGGTPLATIIISQEAFDQVKWESATYAGSSSTAEPEQQPDIYMTLKRPLTPACGSYWIYDNLWSVFRCDDGKGKWSEVEYGVEHVAKKAQGEFVGPPRPIVPGSFYRHGANMVSGVSQPKEIKLSCGSGRVCGVDGRWCCADETPIACTPDTWTWALRMALKRPIYIGGTDDVETSKIVEQWTQDLNRARRVLDECGAKEQHSLGASFFRNKCVDDKGDTVNCEEIIAVLPVR